MMFVDAGFNKIWAISRKILHLFVTIALILYSKLLEHTKYV